MSHFQHKKMQDFNRNVLDDFAKRLYHKFNNKQQGFDSDIIDQIISKVKSKIQDPLHNMFKKAILPKVCHSQGSVSNNKTKEEENVERKKQNEREKEETRSESRGSYEDEIDYAVAFDDEPGEKKHKDQLTLVVKQELESNEDSQEQQEKQRETRMKKFKERINLHILGTYERKSKKHIARDESTILQLQNVFIQDLQKKQEYFTLKLCCHFTKK